MKQDLAFSFLQKSLLLDQLSVVKEYGLQPPVLGLILGISSIVGPVTLFRWDWILEGVLFLRGD